MRWFLVAIVAVGLAGCGAERKTADKKVRAEMAKVQMTCAEGINCESERPFRKCTNVERGFRACSTLLTSDKHSTIYVRAEEGWRKVSGPLPHRLGWWRRVLPAPDRQMLLAQWPGECEIQSTYMVSAATGKARPIFDHQESQALGCTSGRARVAVPNTSYYASDGGRPFAPGIYLVDSQTLAVRLERRLPDRHGC
jgi:hypothetical protein